MIEFNLITLISQVSRYNFEQETPRHTATDGIWESLQTNITSCNAHTHTNTSCTQHTTQCMCTHPVDVSRPHTHTRTPPPPLIDIEMSAAHDNSATCLSSITAQRRDGEEPRGKKGTIDFYSLVWMYACGGWWVSVTHNNGPCGHNNYQWSVWEIHALWRASNQPGGVHDNYRWNAIMFAYQRARYKKEWSDWAFGK